MKYFLVYLISLATLTIANPVPEAEAAAKPWEFYGAIQSTTALAKRVAEPTAVPVPVGKRSLIVRSDDIIPTELLTKRGILQKRTQSPTSGPDANKCAPNNPGAGSVVYTCGAGNDGPCCSINGWCGANSYYCGGGCQDDFGSCVLPYLQLTYDADATDAIWDVTSDNVFDAEVGDGIIYYGATPTGGWP